ncbi:MAG TPA: hypothetical protein PLV68_07630, partial [Ilumatobacteraceae bacterium]|nr:hypothetical protein [Ilumatobacteraceae bacterium]
HNGDDVWVSWRPDAAFLLRGRSAIVGATTTDVDEVQATLDGKDAVTTAAAKPDVSGSRVNRRALLIGGGVVAAGAVGALFLSGTGKSGSSSSGGGAGTIGGLGGGADEVRILNWQAYIDPSEDGAVGTVDRFARETGIRTAYSEDFNDNNEVFNKQFQANIGQGGTMDFDIACPTYWMAARIKNLGWLDPIPYDLVPNYANLDPLYLNQAWDKGGKYNLPWQAGMTGLAYNAKLCGRDLTSIND